jgi:hypothetical protein
MLVAWRRCHLTSNRMAERALSEGRAKSSIARSFLTTLIALPEMVLTGLPGSDDSGRLLH